MLGGVLGAGERGLKALGKPLGGTKAVQAAKGEVDNLLNSDSILGNKLANAQGTVADALNLDVANPTAQKYRDLNRLISRGDLPFEKQLTKEQLKAIEEAEKLTPEEYKKMVDLLREGDREHAIQKAQERTVTEQPKETAAEEQPKETPKQEPSKTPDQEILDDWEKFEENWNKTHKPEPTPEPIQNQTPEPVKPQPEPYLKRDITPGSGQSEAGVRDNTLNILGQKRKKGITKEEALENYKRNTGREAVEVTPELPKENKIKRKRNKQNKPLEEEFTDEDWRANGEEAANRLNKLAKYYAIGDEKVRFKDDEPITINLKPGKAEGSDTSYNKIERTLNRAEYDDRLDYIEGKGEYEKPFEYEGESVNEQPETAKELEVKKYNSDPKIDDFINRYKNAVNEDGKPNAQMRNKLVVRKLSEFKKDPGKIRDFLVKVYETTEGEMIGFSHTAENTVSNIVSKIPLAQRNGAQKGNKALLGLIRDAELKENPQMQMFESIQKKVNAYCQKNGIDLNRIELSPEKREILHTQQANKLKAQKLQTTISRSMTYGSRYGVENARRLFNENQKLLNEVLGDKAVDRLRKRLEYHEGVIKNNSKNIKSSDFDIPFVSDFYRDFRSNVDIATMASRSKSVTKLIETNDLFKYFESELKDVGEFKVAPMPDSMITDTLRGKTIHPIKTIFINMRLVGNNSTQFVKTLMHEVEHAKQQKKYEEYIKVPKLYRTSEMVRHIENFEECGRVNKEKQEYRKKHSKVLTKIFKEIQNLDKGAAKEYIKALDIKDKKIYNEYVRLHNQYKDSQFEIEAREASEKITQKAIDYENKRRTGIRKRRTGIRRTIETSLPTNGGYQERAGGLGRIQIRSGEQSRLGADTTAKRRLIDDSFDEDDFTKDVQKITDRARRYDLEQTSKTNAGAQNANRYGRETAIRGRNIRRNVYEKVQRGQGRSVAYAFEKPRGSEQVLRGTSELKEDTPVKIYRGSPELKRQVVGLSKIFQSEKKSSGEFLEKNNFLKNTTEAMKALSNDIEKIGKEYGLVTEEQAENRLKQQSPGGYGYYFKQGYKNTPDGKIDLTKNYNASRETKEGIFGRKVLEGFPKKGTPKETYISNLKEDMRRRYTASTIDFVEKEFAKPIPENGNVKQGYVAVNKHLLANAVYDKRSQEWYKTLSSGEKAIREAFKNEKIANSWIELSKRCQTQDFQIPKTVYDKLFNSAGETLKEYLEQYGKNAPIKSLGKIAGAVLDVANNSFKRGVLTSSSFILNNRFGNQMMIAAKYTPTEWIKSFYGAKKLKDADLPTEVIESSILEAVQECKRRQTYTGWVPLDNFLNLFGGHTIDTKTLRTMKEGKNLGVKQYKVENGKTVPLNVEYKHNLKSGLAEAANVCIALPNKGFNQICDRLMKFNEAFERFERKQVYAIELDKVRKNLVKKTGQKMITQQEAVKVLNNSPEITETVIRHIEDTLGDYNNFNHFEKRVLKRLVPFYSWYRTISRHTVQLAKENPARFALVMLELQKLRDQDEDLKEYQRGSIRTGIKDSRSDKELLINKTAQIPYNTFKEFIDEGGKSGLAPAVKVPLEAARGKKFFNDSEITDKNYMKNSFGKNKGYQNKEGKVVSETLPMSTRMKYLGKEALYTAYPLLRSPLVKPEATYQGIRHKIETGEYLEPDKTYDASLGGYYSGEEFNDKLKRYAANDTSNATKQLNRLFGLSLQNKAKLNKKELKELKEKWKRQQEKRAGR